MSWGDYVTMMTNQGAVFCGVYSKEGAVCAQTPNFNVTPTEVMHIKDCCEGKEGCKLELNGWSCVLMLSNKDEGFAYGKTKAQVHQDSKVFVHCEETNGLVVVVGMTGPAERSASVIVKSVTDYLKGKGL